jgi:F420-non-reducing hydrogenase small subunit
MSTKPKIAFYWCASCGGCEESVVDLAEKVLDVVAAVDIVFWPCALDFKTRDLEAMADGELDVAFVNGAVRTAEQEHMATLLRRKSKCLIAFGACAAHGGIPALANLTSRSWIFRASYHESPTVANPRGTEPVPESTVDGHRLRLPEFRATVRRLADVVEVDYSMCGCPPTSDNLAQAVTTILSGNLPPRGAVLGPAKALCASCKRNTSKPDDLAIPSIRRVVDVELKPDTCFLTQGVVCLGPVTRDGCGAPCVEGNMPCTGCYGPPEGVRDQGAKMVAAIGGAMTADTAEATDSALARLEDPAGTFYRYTMAASLLGSARKEA